MKRIYISIVAHVMATMCMAQNATEFLPLSVVVEQQAEPFPAQAKGILQNRLLQLLSHNGVAGMDYLSQFFLTAVVEPVDKDVLAGPPAKVVETMDVTLFIADYSAQKVLASTTMRVKGIGENENRCYLKALGNLNLNNQQMKAFVQEGKEKIVRYYDSEAANILKKAAYLAGQKQYEEALSMIALIPSQCKAYDETLQQGLSIYQQLIDQRCVELLAQARMAWAAEQNAIGAQKAGEFLAEIYPDAKCYEDAMSLYKEIKGKVLDDWKFEMKQYQDGVDLEKQRIGAMREVGVAFGKGQQPTTTNIGFLR